MSRIGKLPVNLPKGVTVSVSDTNLVRVKGPLGELTQAVDKDLKVEVVGNEVILSRQYGCWSFGGIQKRT
jgi:large subunit ribosomal protein L6